MSATPSHESSREQAIAAVVVGPLTALGVDLEDISITKAGRRELVRVTVDRDGGVDLDTVADVSRVVSEALDGPDLAPVMPGAFVLEVSSPGVDRPLTEPRHWRRAIGRLVEIQFADGTTIKARIRDVRDDGEVVVEAKGSETVIDPSQVRSAIVQVEFDAQSESTSKNSGEGEK